MGPLDCKLGVLEQKIFFERVPINMTGNCLFESLDTKVWTVFLKAGSRLNHCGKKHAITYSTFWTCETLMSWEVYSIP